MSVLPDGHPLLGRTLSGFRLLNLTGFRSLLGRVRAGLRSLLGRTLLANTPLVSPENIQQAICEIEFSDSRIHGCLVSINIGDNGEVVHGIIATLEFVDVDALSLSSTVDLVMRERRVTVPLDKKFVCDLYNVIFIKLAPPQAQLIRAELEGAFLAVAYKSPAIGEQVLAIRPPIGDVDAVTAIGAVYELWGFDMFYTSATATPSQPGCPVLNSRGELTGIQKSTFSRSNRERRAKVATQLAYISKSIAGEAEVRWNSDPSTDPSVMQPLSPVQIQHLKMISLELVAPNLLVSPKRPGITPIWFRRTTHFWFWTPNDPNGNRSPNWMRISHEDHMKVIGGYWSGIEPVSRHKLIITILKTRGFAFLR